MVSGEKPADWGHLAPRHAIRHLSGESKWGKRARCWAPNRSIVGSGGSGAVLRGWPPVPKTPASRPRRAKDDPTWITYYELVGPNNALSSRGRPSTRTVDGHAFPNHQRMRDCSTRVGITAAGDEHQSRPEGNHVGLPVRAVPLLCLPSPGTAAFGYECAFHR
jgi:hypothetical protein